MEGELIYVSIITSLFGILALLILNRNWFIKMRFRTELDLLKKKNNLEIKRLERQLNKEVPATAPEKSTNAQANLLTQLAPLLKNLDADQIQGLIETFTGGPTETEAPDSLSGMIANFAQENPEMVASFLEGLKNKVGSGPGPGTQTY